MKFQRNVPNLAKLSRWDENRDAKGPLKATRVSIEFNSISFFYYFFGVSTGVGTLSMTEDEPRMLVI